MVSILKVLRQCEYCQRDMTETVSSEGYRQNPYCNDCLPERVKGANAPNQTIELVGRYFHFNRESQITD